MSKSFSLVQQIRIASPCHVSWNQMEGDDKRRFCFQCRKHVHDLSKHSTEEIELLLKEAPVCGRVWRRLDGTILTSDCSVGARKRRDRINLWFARAGALLAIICAGAVTKFGFRASEASTQYGQKVFKPRKFSHRTGLENLQSWDRLQSSAPLPVNYYEESMGSILLPTDD